jgi:Glycosyltransferase family 87
MFTLPIDARSRNILMLILVTFCAACMVYYHLALFVPRAHEVRAAQGFGDGYSFGADFFPIWLTSRASLIPHRDPYSPEMTRQIQIGLFGRSLDTSNPSAPSDYRAFAYPVFVDVLFWPLALLPFSTVRLGLAVILPAITALSVVLWLRTLRFRLSPATLGVIVLLTLSNYAVLEGLFAEQIGLLVGFLLAASLAALVDDRLSLSGILLALTLIKPQMTALVVAYLLLWSLDQWRTRWRFVGSFLFTSALLVASSLLVWPGWISQWLHVVFGYRQYSTPPLVGYLLGSQIGSRLTPFLIAMLLASGLALALRRRHASPDSTEFALTFSLLLAITTIALLPGHAVYDHVVLLPGILLIALSWRIFTRSIPLCRVVLGVTALAFFWQWILAPAVIAARPFVSPQLFASAVLTLPIRTAASIPFGVLALLGLMMRQLTRKEIASDGSS